MLLGIFLLSIWSLTFVTSRVLRADLENSAGERLFSTVTIVADQLNHAFVERSAALELIARQIQPAQIAAPAAVQTLLEEDPLLQSLFNGGTFVTDTHGIAIASVPQSVGRKGVNYSERDHIIAALKDGRPTVSEPVLGKLLGVPVVSMAAPIHDRQGNVLGALVGVINLNQSNFLDQMVKHAYGSGGGYVLVDPRHRRVVTATDKRNNLTALPAPGVNAMADRYAQGYQGYGIYRTSDAVESLSAAHTVEVPGWYVMALLPASEAFAPIKAIESKMLLVAGLLTFVAACLIDWILRRELAPILTTASKLAELSESTSFPRALDVKRHDEVGLLIGGFNRLLEVLHQREAATVESETRFRTLVEWLSEGLIVHDGTRIVYANSTALKVLDAQAPDELIGKPLLSLVHPSSLALATERAKQAVAEGAVMGWVQYRFITLTGRHIEVEGQGIAIRYNGQIASQFAFHDITERRSAEDRLRQLSRITEQAPIAIVITDLRGTIAYVNPRFEQITGYRSDDVVGRNPRILQSGHTPAETYSDLWETLRNGGVWRGEFRNRKRSGELFTERAVLAPVLGPDGHATHYVAIKEDITEQKRHQEALESSLQEKTALLHEVHHRVKNNLQVITSLLRMEGSRAADAVTRSVLFEMKGRIRSMALVHEALYRSGTFAAVDLHTYLQQVATTAFRAQANNNGAVRLVLQLEPVRATLDLATPCGLLVNELISNSLKHGFAKGQCGEICIALQPASPDSNSKPMWKLRVSDTGAGLPADFDVRRSETLGLQLVSDLAGQLGGTLVVEPAADRGAAFSVTFPIESA